MGWESCVGSCFLKSVRRHRRLYHSRKKACIVSGHNRTTHTLGGRPPRTRGGRPTTFHHALILSESVRTSYFDTHSDCATSSDNSHMPITQHITTLAPWVTTPRYNHTRVTPHWFLARSSPTSDRAQALQSWSVASKRQAGYVTTSEYIVDVHSTSVNMFVILLLLSLAHGRALGHWCRFPHLLQRHHRLINVVPRPLLRDGFETFFVGIFSCGK